MHLGIIGNKSRKATNRRLERAAPLSDQRPQSREMTVISCRFFDPKIGESDDGRTVGNRVTPSIFSAEGGRNEYTNLAGGHKKIRHVASGEKKERTV